MLKRLAIWLILLFAFFGVANSAYLAQVAASSYSHFFGYPLADYGIAFYGIIFAVAALELVLVDRLLRRLLQGLALIGLLASAYFVFVQIAFINAICIYCTASAVLALLVFLLACLIEPIQRTPKAMITPPPRSLSMPPR